MPSANDHVVLDSGAIAPGLGRDEPSPTVKATFIDKRQADLEKMAAEISVRTEELNIREQRVDERELDVVRALKDIKEREEDLAKRLNTLKAREAEAHEADAVKKPAEPRKPSHPTG